MEVLIFLLAFGALCLLAFTLTDSAADAVFIIGMGFLIAGSAHQIGSDDGKRQVSKKPVKPVMHVECTGRHCDTTYIYKFKP